MRTRVVVTGLGVVAPNGVGVDAFLKAIQNGESGITFQQKLKDLSFSCQVGGIPTVSEKQKLKYFTKLQLKNFVRSSKQNSKEYNPSFSRRRLVSVALAKTSPMSSRACWGWCFFQSTYGVPCN